jgi:murein L,D-transpeptidase YcbB/YkuD
VRQAIAYRHDDTMTRARRVGLLAAFCLLSLLGASLLPVKAAKAEQVFNPWEQNWVDPWQSDVEARPAEQPVSQSTLPTLGDSGFWPLLRAMSMYEQIEEWGGWASVPDGEKIEPGDRDTRIPLIRQRLVATGDLSISDGDPNVYDARLEKAVKRFQTRHGLAPDGIVGHRSIKAMNVPVSQRIKQIAINIKRLNKLAPKLGRRYVFVNIAGQEVEAVSDGKVDLRRRVIVGKQDRQTPEYTSKITFVALNPYWNVPQSIARRDLIPKAARDPGYFKRMGIRVFNGYGGREVSPYSVDWTSPSATRYFLRQDPSRRNSLGTVKIHFPNPHAVYLHDTPSKSLFWRSSRAYSSGCVRVEHVHDLSAWLLSETPGWDRARIDNVIDKTHERLDVTLQKSVPVYMLYLTSWVDGDGLLNFRDDIYSIDKKTRTTSLR